MNKHIELVKKWLKDRDSVSLEELEANKENAYAADAAAYYAYATAYAAHTAADYTDYTGNAIYWVERYEELINE